MRCLLTMIFVAISGESSPPSSSPSWRGGDRTGRKTMAVSANGKKH